jgi:Peptidase S46
MAEIEKESLDKTGLRSNVITLYQGASYQLYRYKRYTDVRLVFAPEQQIAFYGGDPDNCEYPRYDLDICIFRVYENGKPVHPSDYLKFSTLGPSDNELVFVSGNPGSTQREKTVAQFAAARDIELPFIQSVLDRREVAVAAFSARRPEYALQAREELFSLRNSRKVCDGRLAGLLDPDFFGMLKQREAKLEAKFQENPKFQSALDVLARINETQKEISAQLIKFQLLEGDLRGGPRTCLTRGVPLQLYRCGSGD